MFFSNINLIALMKHSLFWTFFHIKSSAVIAKFIIYLATVFYVNKNSTQPCDVNSVANTVPAELPLHMFLNLMKLQKLLW